jgi:XTP/dITP diphosphohydrolase
VHRLFIATHNPHKTREFGEILGVGFEVRDLTNVNELQPIEETGTSFTENAILKAIKVSRQFPELIVADDSGLEVDALQGAPGIYSARYAGTNSTDAENIAKLMRELVQHAPPHSARFRCSLAVAKGGRILKTFDGIVEGIIVNPPRGEAGFGYDPVFQPKGFEQTFGELSAAEKHRISHRARAIQLLRTELLDKGLM